jgi:hypothetical protein
MEWYSLTRACGKFLDPWAVRLEILNNGILIIRLVARLIVSDETFLPNPDIDDLWRYAVPQDISAELCWKLGKWEGCVGVASA